jgi:hypothetical protein
MEQEETAWRVIAYLLQLVQRALSDTTLLEVVLRRIHHLLDDLLVDIALFLSISYCNLAYPDRRRGRSQHTTSAFVMTAVVRRKSIRSWQRCRGSQRIVIRGRKGSQDVAVASVRRTYLTGTTQESGVVMRL